MHPHSTVFKTSRVLFSSGVGGGVCVSGDGMYGLRWVRSNSVNVKTRLFPCWIAVKENIWDESSSWLKPNQFEVFIIINCVLFSRSLCWVGGSPSLQQTFGLRLHVFCQRWFIHIFPSKLVWFSSRATWCSQRGMWWNSFSPVRGIFFQEGQSYFSRFFRDVTNAFFPVEISISVDLKQISVVSKSEKEKKVLFIFFSFSPFLTSLFPVGQQKFPGEKRQVGHSAPCLPPLRHWILCCQLIIRMV